MPAFLIPTSVHQRPFENGSPAHFVPRFRPEPIVHPAASMTLQYRCEQLGSALAREGPKLFDSVNRKFERNTE